MSAYPHTVWRLIWSSPVDGATNMAVDEAILEEVVSGRSVPTLRLYAWEPACLSLGRMQAATDADREALQARGIDLVRRPTGGKAILHCDELTYSVAAPEGEPRVAGPVLESYRRLCAGLVSGLERLGVTGVSADCQVGDGPPGGPVCFQVPSDYEMTVGGKKLVGSAQMRVRGGVLQHGALPLNGDIARICPLLTADPDPAGVRARATTLAQVLGRTVSWQAAGEALAAGFAEVLALSWVVGDLSAGERTRAAELREEKYASEAWTSRVD